MQPQQARWKSTATAVWPNCSTTVILITLRCSFEEEPCDWTRWMCRRYVLGFEQIRQVVSKSFIFIKAEWLRAAADPVIELESVMSPLHTAFLESLRLVSNGSDSLLVCTRCGWATCGLALLVSMTTGYHMVMRYNDMWLHRRWTSGWWCGTSIDLTSLIANWIKPLQKSSNVWVISSSLWRVTSQQSLLNLQCHDYKIVFYVN